MHDHVLTALLEQVGQERLDQPLAAVGDGRAGADSHQVVVEMLDLLDPGDAHEPGRPRRHQPRHLGDELAAAVLARREELHLDLARSARLHVDGLDIGVVHAHDLAADRPQAGRAQAHLVDDALQVERLRC